ncbi:MAG: tripartite tricarboxylate transporter substrate binding protein [Ramlibacter sp.]|nr:tripartite tricarboxylate transporter substrate binding protein [Ramlibacter sp.]
MPTRRQFASHLAAGAVSAASASSVFSQGVSPSSSTSTLIVPFSAGSLADLLARRYATLLAEASGNTHLIDNLPGGAGVIASRALLRRPADGRTLLWANSGLICNTPLLAKPPLDFDPVTDFTPVCIFAASPFVLFAGRDFPASSLDELQRFARAQAEPVSYVGADVGSANHVAAEVLMQRLGARGMHVPYRNNQQAYLDVSEGRVQVGVFGWNNIAPLVKAGKAKILAVLADKPLLADPGIPTMASQGHGRFDIQGWFGLFALKGTPAVQIAEHEKQMQAMLRNKGFADFLVDAGQEPAFRGHAQAVPFVEAEVDRYRRVLQRLKLI